MFPQKSLPSISALACIYLFLISQKLRTEYLSHPAWGPAPPASSPWPASAWWSSTSSTASRQTSSPWPGAGTSGRSAACNTQYKRSTIRVKMFQVLHNQITCPSNSDPPHLAKVTITLRWGGEIKKKKNLWKITNLCFRYFRNFGVSDFYDCCPLGSGRHRVKRLLDWLIDWLICQLFPIAQLELLGISLWRAKSLRRSKHYGRQFLSLAE